MLDTLNEMKRIMNFIGLSRRLNENEEIKLPSFTKGQHLLYGKKPNVSMIERWKKELSLNEIKVFEYYCNLILDLLGYELISFKGKPLKLLLLKYMVIELVKKKLNKREHKRIRNIKLSRIIAS